MGSAGGTGRLRRGLRAIAVRFAGVDSVGCRISHLRNADAARAAYVLVDRGALPRAADRDCETSPKHCAPGDRNRVPLRKDRDNHRMSRVAIMGSGAWGTAIALSLARRGGHTITLWSYAHDVAAMMRATRENTAFLPGFLLPDSIAITTDAAEELDTAEIVVSVAPS